MTGKPARLRLSLIATVCILCTGALSQDVLFERLTIADGLSQSSVFAITQDTRGFMWFGTQDGLNRYDGYSFKVYRYRSSDTSSLSSNHITRLLVTRRGDLWVGTAGRGVNRFVPDQDLFVRFLSSPGDTSSLSDNDIWALYEDSRGTIWIGTDKGLNALDPVTGKIARFFTDTPVPEGVRTEWTRCIIEDDEGRLWFGHPGGLSWFDPETGQFRFFAHPESEFVSFARTPDGRLFAFSSNKAFELATRLSSSDPTPVLHPLGEEESSLQAAFASGDGRVWIGSFGGLRILGNSTGKRRRFLNDPLDPTSLSDNAVLSLFSDRSNVLWVGTYGGISKYVPRRRRFSTTSFGRRETFGGKGDRVRSFAEDRNGRIWIGTEVGLYRLNPATGAYHHFVREADDPSSLNVNHIWSVVALRDSPGVTIACGTNGGGINILRFSDDPDDPRPEVEHIVHGGSPPTGLPAPGVSSLFEGQRGELWVGTLREGAARYDRRSKVFERFMHDPLRSTSLSNRSVTVILQTRDGTVWVGTRGGLNKFEAATRSFTHFLNDPSNPQSISDDIIESLNEDADGVLWVGTSAGLNRWDPSNGRFSRYTTENGLPNDVIYGVLRDKRGNIWSSTNAGLVKFMPEGGLVRSYDVSDGLQSNEFNQGAAYLSSNGTMYFGGIAGFNAFHPDSIHDNPHLPDVAFTDVKVLNRSLRIGPDERRLRSTIVTADRLFLTYTDQVLTFEFTALEFTHPERNQYMFRMDGFDEQWRFAGLRREATYTNLDPGTYVFRVRAANNDGIWNQKDRSIVVFIAPPFWETLWFRSLLFVSVVATGYAGYRRRIRSLRRDAALQEEISRRLIESQEQERKRIATDLHDGLGQDLLIIKNRAHLAHQAIDDRTRLIEQIEHIGKRVSESLVRVRRIARNLRPYHLDRLGLSAALRSTLEEVAESSSLSFDIQIQDIDSYFAGRKDLEVNIFRVVQESVNNILKHADARHASVHVSASDGFVRVLISDDGKGFDPSVLSSPSSSAGLGIQGIVERIQVLGGTHALDSAAGRGTNIRILIPISPQRRMS